MLRYFVFLSYLKNATGYRQADHHVDLLNGIHVMKSLKKRNEKKRRNIAVRDMHMRTAHGRKSYNYL